MGTLNGEHERKGHPQGWVAAGAVISLMESAGVLATVSVGLSMYTCSLDTSPDIVWQLVRLYYFSHESCAPYIIEENHIHFDGVNKAALRTVIIMSLYVVLSSVWFIGSILLLVSAAKGKKMDPNLGRQLHNVWTVPLVLIIILDVIATILYCVDLLSTGDFNSVMGLLNIKPDGTMNEIDAEYLSEPPEIMALLACKAVILWVINVAMLIILLVQFKKLFLLRKHQMFIQAQLDNVPAYLWPPKLVDKNLSTSGVPAHVEPTPTIPRLMSQDGVLIRAQPSGSAQRSSALQMAARQGFNYERPPSQASLSRGPQMTSPQRYGYGGGYGGSPPQDNYDNWYSRNSQLPPPQENERSSNILQRDNDVFY